MTLIVRVSLTGTGASLCSPTVRGLFARAVLEQNGDEKGSRLSHSDAEKAAVDARNAMTAHQI